MISCVTLFDKLGSIVVYWKHQRKKLKNQYKLSKKKQRLDAIQKVLLDSIDALEKFESSSDDADKDDIFDEDADKR